MTMTCMTIMMMISLVAEAVDLLAVEDEGAEDAGAREAVETITAAVETIMMTTTTMTTMILIMMTRLVFGGRTVVPVLEAWEDAGAGEEVVEVLIGTDTT